MPMYVYVAEYVRVLQVRAGGGVSNAARTGRGHEGSTRSTASSGHRQITYLVKVDNDPIFRVISFPSFNICRKTTKRCRRPYTVASAYVTDADPGGKPGSPAGRVTSCKHRTAKQPRLPPSSGIFSPEFRQIINVLCRPDAFLPSRSVALSLSLWE